MHTQLKSISLIIGDTHSSARITAHAASLAQRHGAHLIGVFFVSVTAQSLAHRARGKPAIYEAIDQLRREHEKMALAASSLLQALAIQYGISVEFRVIWTNSSGQVPVRSLRSDLVIVGYPYPSHLSHPLRLERLLFTSGLPFLVIPSEWPAEKVGSRIVLAWNDSREAKRAIIDALPLIEEADRVSVLMVDAEHRGGLPDSNPGAEIITLLASRGVVADLRLQASEGMSIAKAILTVVTKSDADLLVIGACSRAWIPEMLLGDVTRTLLASTTVPLLLSR